jgi:hypothetical protein
MKAQLQSDVRQRVDEMLRPGAKAAGGPAGKPASARASAAGAPSRQPSRPAVRGPRQAPAKARGRAAPPAARQSGGAWRRGSGSRPPAPEAVYEDEPYGGWRDEAEWRDVAER